MKTKYFQQLTATVLCAMCLLGCNENKDKDRGKDNVVVGDLAFLELLPGSPVEHMSWEYEYYTREYSFDANARVINDDPCLIDTEIEVKASSDGEKCTVVNYEYDDSDCGDMYLTWVYGRVYDSKGRIITVDSGASSHSFVYDAENRIAVDKGTGEGDYWKTVYKYNKDGHCIYMAEYFPIDYTENYEPVYGSRPDYETYYEILKVDDHGNWTARKSSDGEIERRVITYKKPRKNS